MSGNDFNTFEIRNRKWPSMSLKVGTGNWNEKSNSLLSGLRMWMKTKITTFGNGKLYLISQKVGNVHNKMPLPHHALCWACLATPIHICYSDWKSSTWWIETTLFPNKIPHVFYWKFGLRMGMKNRISEYWDWEWDWKTVLPTFWIGNSNKKQCF